MESRSKHFRKRDAILEFMRQTDAHPSAETVHAGLKATIPDISLGTVYRNLALFKQQGLIQSLGSVQGVERFDGNVEPHVHFICTECGKIQDLHEMQVPQDLSDQASILACAKIRQCQLTFSGACEECAALSSL